MGKPKPTIPFEFVLENLNRLDFTVKAFFGCHSIYVGEKLYLTLRKKKDHKRDNGVWIATSHEHHESLQREFPNMRSIELFGNPPSSLQNLPADADDFEESVNHLCELIMKKDSRIGRIPKKKKKK
jgi:hypothetical protein